MMAESRRWIPSCLAQNPLQFAVLEDYLNKMSEDLLLHPAAPPHMSRKKTVSFRKHPTCSGRNREHTRDAGPLRRETPHAARGPAGLDPPALLLLAQQSRRRGAAPLRKHARAIRPHGGGPGARGWGGLSSGSGPMKVHTLVSSHPDPIHQVGHTRELETGSTLRQPEKHYRVLAHARLIRGPGHPASRPLSEAGLCSFLPPSSYTSFASFLRAVHKASPCTSGSDPTCATALRKHHVYLPYLHLRPLPSLVPRGDASAPHGALQLALQMSARNGNLSSNKLRLRHEDRTRTSQLLGSRGTKGQAGERAASSSRTSPSTRQGS